MKSKGRRKQSRVAIYARVSTDRQAESETVDSQIAELKQRIETDGNTLDQELAFVDDGYSGSVLERPALEKMRDIAAAGGFDKVYVYDPDRLARRYAYQVLIVDELQRCGIEVAFLNRPHGGSAEDHLLLQVQGMMAEYERAKILERSRRGKVYAARQGKLNVMSGAPYGYRYISKQEGAGVARYEVLEDEACIVRWVYELVAVERASIGEVRRQLIAKGVMTRTGKKNWDRATIHGILKNPAYKGEARYGKTRCGEKRTEKSRRKGSPDQGKQAHSRYHNIENSVAISVPAIVSKELFDAVARQLDENRKRHRRRGAGPSFLLQGLTVCRECGYAYCGDCVTHKRPDGTVQWQQKYYRCSGGRTGKNAEGRLCFNRQVRTDDLEKIVWADVCKLLNSPERITAEYERRLDGQQPGEDHRRQESIRKQIRSVNRGIARLIDAYRDGLIDKAEFEPRIARARDRLVMLKDEDQEMKDDLCQRDAIQRTIGALSEFSKQVKTGIDQADWETRRGVTQALIKNIEIGEESVHIVYRINQIPFVLRPKRGKMDSCLWRHRTTRTILNEPEILVMIVRFKNLKVIKSVVLVSILTQRLPTGYNDFPRVHCNCSWSGHKWLFRSRLEHVVGVRMIQRNLLLLQSW